MLSTEDSNHYYVIMKGSRTCLTAIVAGQEKPHMCIGSLNMYAKQNITKKLRRNKLKHVPGPQIHLEGSVH